MRRIRVPAPKARQLSWLLALTLSLAFVAPGLADTGGTVSLPTLPEVFKKATPTSVEDLKAIQDRVQLLVKKVMPSVVNLRIGAGQGSGIIISDDGLIMTAGHVSGSPGQKVFITMANGKKLKGVTLGANRIVDSGLVKITDKLPDTLKLPVAEIGSSADLKKGDWCLAIGHPGGLQPGRDPVVRLGRVLENHDDVIRTDCSLVGGDSGGPLFDMDGKVIGIHSRIMFFVHQNYHVPAKVYQDDWVRLLKSDEIYPGYLGVKRDPDEKVCKISEIVAKSAAEKAGLQVNDVITKVGDRAIGSFDDLADLIGKMRSGDELVLQVQRGGETITLNVVLGTFKK